MAKSKGKWDFFGTAVTEVESGFKALKDDKSAGQVAALLPRQRHRRMGAA